MVESAPAGQRNKWQGVVGPQVRPESGFGDDVVREPERRPSVDRLWSVRDAAGLAPGGEFEAERRLEGELGYGFGAFGGRGVVTPYAGLGLAEAGDRTWRAGARWSLAPHLAMSLDGTRREAANDDGPEHGVRFRLGLRW